MDLEPLQHEEVFEGRELTPPEQLQQQWKQQPGLIAFLKQKNVIDQNAELLPYANPVLLPGWSSPRAFAIQGLVAVAVLLSVVNWMQTRNRGKLEDEITAVRASVVSETGRQQGIIDASQLEAKRVQRSNSPGVWKGLAVTREEALQQLSSAEEEARRRLEQFKENATVQEHELRASQQRQAVINSGTPIIFSLALVLAAGLVAGGLRRDFPKANVRAGGDDYLYLVTAYGIWPNLAFLVLLHYALSGASYGITGIADSIGPLFWIVFWIGLYALLLRTFVVVAHDMYKALQMRQRSEDWSLENKMLVRIHNSFFAVFAIMEAAFLSLTYLVYVVAKQFA